MTARKFKIETNFSRAGKPVSSRDEEVAFGNDFDLNLKAILTAAGFKTNGGGQWRYPYHEWDGEGPEQFTIVVTEIVDPAVPAFVGKVFKCNPDSREFMLVPEIEDVSPHGTVGQAGQIYRRLYIQSGKTIRIGNKAEVECEIGKWIPVG